MRYLAMLMLCVTLADVQWALETSLSYWRPRIELTVIHPVIKTPQQSMREAADAMDAEDAARVKVEKILLRVKTEGICED